MKFISRCFSRHAPPSCFLVRRNFPRHEQPDESVRLERSALRLDPGRARAGASHLAVERSVCGHRRASRRAHVGHGVRSSRPNFASGPASCCTTNRPLVEAFLDSRRRPGMFSSAARARCFFPVCRTAIRKRFSNCCARNMKPRSSRASSSKRRAISGSGSAAKRRPCGPVWRDSARPWTSLEETLGGSRIEGKIFRESRKPREPRNFPVP